MCPGLFPGGRRGSGAAGGTKEQSLSISGRTKRLLPPPPSSNPHQKPLPGRPGRDTDPRERGALPGLGESAAGVTQPLRGCEGLGAAWLCPGARGGVGPWGISCRLGIVDPDVGPHKVRVDWECPWKDTGEGEQGEMSTGSGDWRRAGISSLIPVLEGCPRPSNPSCA